MTLGLRVITDAGSGVIRVINMLFDDRFGGPQRRVIQVAIALREYDVETTIVFPEGDGNAKAKAGEAGISSVRLPFQRPPALRGGLISILKWCFFLPQDIYHFYRFFKKNKADIIHVNGAVFLAPAIAAKLSGISLCWHLNDTVLPKPIAIIFGFLVRMMANKIAVAAMAVADHYGIPHDSAFLLYAPVDINKYTPISHSEYKNKITVGVIGNWNPLKGIDTFLYAMKKLKDVYLGDLEIKMAGAKLNTHREYARKIEKIIADSGLSDCITHKGFVEDVPAFLRSLDVLVMSSISEACPMAVLEGMASEVPVVSTDVGGVRELVSIGGIEAGIVVPSSDPEAIAEAVLKLSGDSETRRRMGFNGRKLAKENFSLDRCVERHLECYRSLDRQMVRN